MESQYFNNNIYIKAVHLNVADLERSTLFYTHTLGLCIIEQHETYTVIGTSAAQIYLYQTDKKAAANQAALYHLALLVPDRTTLGRLLMHFENLQQPLSDASFHSVCESIYTKDPDGNTIEIYHDLPSDSWRYNQDGTIVLGIHPLDLSAIKAAADDQPFSTLPDSTVIGHIHLEVLDLDQSMQFYEQMFNMKVTAMNGHFSAFMSTNKYHHHMALNRWNRKTKKVELNSMGIKKIEFAVSTAEDEERFKHQAVKSGVSIDKKNSVIDPNGIEVGLISSRKS